MLFDSTRWYPFKTTMKKIITGLFISLALISCDKNAVQQTTDSIKHADSLFTRADEGLKTLDSLSKTINDSDGIAKKVILPEIQKQKKAIDSTIRSGGFRIDSINKEIEKITKHVVVGTEVVKTLDSANDALNKGESAFKVLTRTAEKILNQTKRQTLPEKSSPNHSSSPTPNQNNTVVVPPLREKYPVVKTAKMEIEVEDLTATKALLKQKIRENKADLVTESYSQTEGFHREYVTVKVPLQNFDGLVRNLSTQLGDLKMKSTESEGIDYIPGQMCDVEVTLVQNEDLASNPLAKNDSGKNADSFGSKSSNAFMSGFKVLESIMLAVLPFWPVLLIAAFIWYFVRKNKRNKEQFKRKNQEPVSSEKITENEITDAEIVDEKATEKTDPTDYSKYLPKK